MGEDITLQVEGATHVKVWKGRRYVGSKVPAVQVGRGVGRKAEDESREREIRTVDFILCKQHRGASEDFKWRSE